MQHYDQNLNRSIMTKINIMQFNPKFGIISLQTGAKKGYQNMLILFNIDALKIETFFFKWIEI